MNNVTEDFGAEIGKELPFRYAVIFLVVVSTNL